MNCDYCDQPLSKRDDDESCQLGCESHAEQNFEELPEYYAFRMAVAKALHSGASTQIEVEKTLEDLDSLVETWWVDEGCYIFADENS